MRLGNFRKRPDQQREGLKSKNKINFLAKANNNIRQVVNKPNPIQNKKKDMEIQVPKKKLKVSDSEHVQTPDLLENLRMIFNLL